MKYNIIYLTIILGILSIGLFSLIYDTNLETTPDTGTINDDEGSIFVLWEQPTGQDVPDLRLATIVIAIILFCGIFASLIILHGEED